MLSLLPRHFRGQESQPLQFNWSFKMPKPTKKSGARSQVRQILNVAPNVQIDMAEWWDDGDRDVILASSGAGKSYLAGVLIEEMLQNRQMVFIIDPEGETWTLQEHYPVIIIGGKKNQYEGIDLAKPDEVQLKNDVKNLVQSGCSVIFDLSDLLGDEQVRVAAILVDALFHAQDDVPENKLRTVKLIVEEAHLFAPQSGNGSESLGAIINVAKRGRKRGINMLFATQRPQAISKEVISQMNRFWLGKVSDANDLKAVLPHLKRFGISEDQIRGLKPNYFYYCGKTAPAEFKSRPRICKHGGKTPRPKGDAQFAASQEEVDNLITKLMCAERSEKT